MQESGEVVGFQCPACGRMSISACIDTQFTSFGRQSHRKCEYCGVRFSTVEVVGDARIAERIVMASKQANAK